MEEFIPLLVSAGLAIIPIFAPLVTAAIKSVVAAAGAQVPNAAKPVVNAAAAVILGALCGVDPTTSLIVGQVGKSVRDQLDK